MPETEPGTASSRVGEQTSPEPRSAAVTFATTEHFTLQGARASTISESTGRATMFLTSVSGGLVALGLVATASQVGTAFYVFALILLPTLAFVGFVTFDRVLQSGMADHAYARRIARLRAYYVDNAPELTSYLASGTPADRLHIPGAWRRRWQQFLTIAGMIGVITAVLAGSAAGLVASVASNHALGVSFGVGGVVGVIALGLLMRHLNTVWERHTAEPLFGEESAS